jgi:sugar O-acyltransferase (sialic acid O-acetyltransferase NeuD family)
MNVGILGWHDGTAGQIDSWYENDDSIRIRLFISHNHEPLNAIKIPRSVDTFSYPANGEFKNRPLIVEEKWWESLSKFGIEAIMIAIDNRFDRFQQLENAKRYRIRVINAIHKTASISETAILGNGLTIYPQVVIGYKVKIDDAVVINTGASIDHHSRIMAGATIDPGCVLAGNVTANKFAQIHTGTVVINKINIGENSEIGAGSLLLKDTKPNSLYFGSPARFVRNLE